MEPFDLLLQLAEKLERLELKYFITGSMATIIYGEPRLTNDIDVVIALQANDLRAISDAFPSPNFYRSEHAMHDAIRDHRQFNIIHPASGLKIDVMVPKDDAFNQSRFSRRREIEITEGISIWFAAPEDVILKKLDYYQQGGSDKHVRDISGVLKMQGGKIDLEYINNWSLALGLAKTWNDVQRGSNEFQ